MWFQFLAQEDPREEDMATHASILAWKIRGQRSLAGYSQWGIRGMRRSRCSEELAVSWECHEPEGVLSVFEGFAPYMTFDLGTWQNKHEY